MANKSLSRVVWKVSLPIILVEATETASDVLLLREVDGGLETVDDDEFQRVMAALEQDLVD